MINQIQKVLIAGDSISYGYGPLVQDILHSKFEVSNLPAISNVGRSSVDLLTHIDEWMIKPKYDVIQVNCGLHDIRFYPEPKKHKVPLEQYAANVEEIIRRLRNETSVIVVWATITPVIDERWKNSAGGAVYERHESDVRNYNDAAECIMSKLNIPINDLHRVIEEAGKEECLGADGVHMTPKGYALLAKAVAVFVSTLKTSVYG